MEFAFLFKDFNIFYDLNKKIFSFKFRDKLKNKYYIIFFDILKINSTKDIYLILIFVLNLILINYRCFC